MSLIKNSFQEQIDNNNRLQFSDTTGTIIKYDRTTETCTVKYPNPNGEGFINRANVNIANSSGGISYGGFRPGQKCSISFINNNINNPVITGIPDTYYQERSNTDQGAYIADDEVWKTGTPEHIIAMNLDWIDDDNTDLSKYQNNSARYTDVNINDQSMDMITSLDKYENNEVGLTNLKNKSNVKLRDNGDIDIFTQANTGIRICADGNIKFYCKDIEFTNSQTETTDKSITTQLKVAQIMKICLGYDIIKEVDRYCAVIEDVMSNDTDLNSDQT